MHTLIFLIVRSLLFSYSGQVLSTTKINTSGAIFKSSLLSLIIGGHESPKRPFFVNIMKNINGVNHQICGGTIIHEEWVLTAAHCVHNRDISKLVIETGDFTNEGAPKTTVQIVQMIRPNKTRNSIYDSDIALLRVKDSKFPLISVLELCYRPRLYCRVLGSCGMGQTNGSNDNSLPATLKEIWLNERPPSLWRPCPDGMICTRRALRTSNDSVSFGDSGGPLYVIGDLPNPDPVCLYGITSTSGFNILSVPPPQCWQAGVLNSVNWQSCLAAFAGRDKFDKGDFLRFTSVPWFYKWIRTTIAENTRQLQDKE